MSRRISSTLTYVLPLLALAASCSSDDKKAAPDEPAAGVGGEAPTNGGSSTLPSGGASGAVAGTSGGSGKSGSPNSAGTGGTATGGSSATGNGGEGEPLGGGAPDGSAGETNQPTGPVSACGAGNYDAGDPGCMTCPTPSVSTALECDDFASAERDGDGNLLLRFSGVPIHEPFGGEVTVDWAESGSPGSATVVWEYSLDLERFVFRLPVEARYADEITVSGWAFTDACSFSFTTGALRLYWDGVESWQCGQNT